MLLPHTTTTTTIALLSTLLPLLALAQSQNDTTSSTNTTTCPPKRYSDDAPTNASATVLVPDSPEWYMTVTLNDTRTNTTADHKIQGWLSTPPNSTASVCMYLISGLLPEASGENGSCEGTGISEGCSEWLREKTGLSATSGERPAGQRCPNLGRGFKEACGDAFEDNGGIVFTTKEMDMSNTTCTDSRVPTAKTPSIIPSDYINRSNFAISGFDYKNESDQTDPSKYTWYLRYVNQPMAWIISSTDNGQSQSKLMCIAPKEQRIERQPEPGESGSVRTSVGAVSLVAGVIVGLGLVV